MLADITICSPIRTRDELSARVFSGLLRGAVGIIKMSEIVQQKAMDFLWNCLLSWWLMFKCAQNSRLCLSQNIKKILWAVNFCVIDQGSLTKSSKATLLQITSGFQEETTFWIHLYVQGSCYQVLNTGHKHKEGLRKAVKDLQFCWKNELVGKAIPRAIIIHLWGVQSSQWGKDRPKSWQQIEIHLCWQWKCSSLKNNV